METRLSPQDLADIERRLSSATPGPWRAEQDQVYAANEVLADICCGEIEQAIADAVFVAAARDDVARLLAEVRALTAELKAVRPGKK
jgi:hypothetical protein